METQQSKVTYSVQPEKRLAAWRPTILGRRPRVTVWAEHLRDKYRQKSKLAATGVCPFEDAYTTDGTEECDILDPSDELAKLYLRGCARALTEGAGLPHLADGPSAPGELVFLTAENQAYSQLQAPSILSRVAYMQSVRVPIAQQLTLRACDVKPDPKSSSKETIVLLVAKASAETADKAHTAGKSEEVTAFDLPMTEDANAVKLVFDEGSKEPFVQISFANPPANPTTSANFHCREPTPSDTFLWALLAFPLQLHTTATVVAEGGGLARAAPRLLYAECQASYARYTTTHYGSLPRDETAVLRVALKRQRQPHSGLGRSEAPVVHVASRTVAPDLRPEKTFSGASIQSACAGKWTLERKTLRAIEAEAAASDFVSDAHRLFAKAFADSLRRAHPDLLLETCTTAGITYVGAKEPDALSSASAVFRSGGSVIVKRVAKLVERLEEAYHCRDPTATEVFLWALAALEDERGQMEVKCDLAAAADQTGEGRAQSWTGHVRNRDPNVKFEVTLSDEPTAARQLSDEPPSVLVLGNVQLGLACNASINKKYRRYKGSIPFLIAPVGKTRLWEGSVGSFFA